MHFCNLLPCIGALEHADRVVVIDKVSTSKKTPFTLSEVVGHRKNLIVAAATVVVAVVIIF